MILMPAISYWTIGPSNTSRSDSSIGVSFFYTFINTILTFIGTTLFYIFISINHGFNCNHFRSFPEFRALPKLTNKCQISSIAYSLFFVSFVCIVILKYFKDSKLCGVPLTDTKYFDINEEDNQIGEEPGIEMTEKNQRFKITTVIPT